MAVAQLFEIRGVQVTDGLCGGAGRFRIIPRLCSKPKMVTNETLVDGRQVPAALNLPFGKLFFGYTVIPYKAPGSEGSGASGSGAPSPPPAAQVCAPITPRLILFPSADANPYCDRRVLPL